MPKAIDSNMIGKVMFTADRASVPIRRTTNSPSIMPKISIKIIEKTVGAANRNNRTADIFPSRECVIEYPFFSKRIKEKSFLCKTPLSAVKKSGNQRGGLLQ